MATQQKSMTRSQERHAGVELLLAENVPSLGKQGDIVRVKHGFARNYLVPQGLATLATEENKKAVEMHRQRQQAMLDAKLAGLRKLADDVSKYSVTIEANANKEGHLFGSIGPRDISESLVKAGFDVQPEHIKMDGPIKELAMYTVKIELHPELISDVKVWVVPVASIT